MQRRSFVVFDDFVQGTSPSGTHFFCATGLFEPLGAFDELSLELWMEHVSGSGGFDLYLEHCADGDAAGFLTYNGVPLTQGFGDISMPGPIDHTTVQTAWANFGGAKPPLLAFVRLRMFFGFSGTSALVRVIAHQRDSAKSQGTQKQRKGVRLRPTPQPATVTKSVFGVPFVVQTKAETDRLARQSVREGTKEAEETLTHDANKSGA